jgi:hypothetical protein
MTQQANDVQPSASAPAPPRTLAHVTQGRRAVPRARPYLRLLWIIPSLAILGAGLYAHLSVAPGGTVDSIKLTTKPGPVGQASEALRLVTGTYDLYLKVKAANEEFQTETYSGRAIGNGLVWPLSRQYALHDVTHVDVFDSRTWRSDSNLDHVSFSAGQWSAEGQLFRVDLQGKANEPPKWALPTLSVGATLTALVLLRFVWDQVV